MAKKVIVIGSGFSGISAACFLAKKGYEVTILEKNDSAGGRARSFEVEGFTFDMGPSWYWMPDVFDKFFAHFGKKVSDYYDLIRLDPSYAVFFGKNDVVEIPAKMDELESLFESYESGSGKKLRAFLKDAQYKYELSMSEFVFKPGLSLFEFADTRVVKSLFHINLFRSISKHIRGYFKNEKLIELLEFPVLFLGAKPKDTPALYSIMNYADMSLGTWYPMGGMHKIVEGMLKLAGELGVKVKLNQEVKQIYILKSHAKKVMTQDSTYEADIVVGGADYHHVEQNILEPQFRKYSPEYWDKRTMAPSSLLFYIGLNKKLKNLQHHNLFFDEDFLLHAEEIYDRPKWPSRPLFYTCVPSITDKSVAPEGCENLFILIPLAPDLKDTEEIREKYYNIVMDRLESLTNQTVRDAVIYKRSFAHNDFKKDYFAFKGNAYGLANTLTQTAILKPKIKSDKVKNLFYTGQLTSPGPGVPPSIISGEVVATQIEKLFKP